MAGRGNAATWLSDSDQKLIEVLDQLIKLVLLFLDEEMLNSNKCAFLELLSNANLGLCLQLMYQLDSLLLIDCRVKVIRHEVVMEQHIKEEVAALSERDLVVDHCEQRLCLLELYSALFSFGGISGQGHGVG